MTLYFGLEYDERVFAKKLSGQPNALILGPKGLLLYLEKLFGLSGKPDDIDFLRVEQYRQVMLAYLKVYADHPAFFQKSFEADQFATAGRLLEMRDDLILGGWDFLQEDGIPERLGVFSKLEQILKNNHPGASDQFFRMEDGYAERFQAVFLLLRERNCPFSRIFHLEPFAFLPPHLRRFFEALQSQQQVPVLQGPESPSLNPLTDLGQLKKLMLGDVAGGDSHKMELKADGSLLIVRGKRDFDLADWVAALAAGNESFKPLCLIPEKIRTLDNALVQAGKPSMGILSASLARPSLQILKLITGFFWKPIDPFKLLEFVTLSIKPLDENLGLEIARIMANSPGIQSEKWHQTISHFFQKLEAKNDPKLQQIRDQYAFWFERPRYPVSGTVPKYEVVKAFEYLKDWALGLFEKDLKRGASYLVLSGQARKIKELLEALPETQLTYLQLERIVRTVYQPAPVQFEAEQVQRFDHIYFPSSILDSPEVLLWWNFSELEPVRFFSSWYASEAEWLKNRTITLDMPSDQNQRYFWQQMQPFLRTRHQVLLVLPQIVEGKSVEPHPLFGFLEASFGNLSPILLDEDSGQIPTIFSEKFLLPGKKSLQHSQLGKPLPLLEIPLKDLAASRMESPTSLELLAFFPHQWVFRYKLRLSKSSILSVVPDHTMFGNLAHRVFEKILLEDFYLWKKHDVEAWVDAFLEVLLAKEGAVLLMYGREPDRINFSEKLKYAAWSLISAIQQNGWQVAGTEVSLQGHFLDRELFGIIDLLLEKEGTRAIVDLKWKGKTYRTNLVKNEEDLQLSLYAHLLKENKPYPKSGYFIISEGLFISRDENIFAEAKAVPGTNHPQEAYATILGKLKATLEWRLEQLQQGLLEVRCSMTAKALEELYAEQEINFFPMLEMKTEDAPFDDYKSLIYLAD